MLGVRTRAGRLRLRLILPFELDGLRARNRQFSKRSLPTDQFLNAGAAHVRSSAVR
jgi:hypothetical protein